jgi:hypothetical protein
MADQNSLHLRNLKELVESPPPETGSVAERALYKDLQWLAKAMLEGFKQQNARLNAIEAEIKRRNGSAMSRTKQAAAQQLGLVSRRVNGKLYPTTEQAAALIEQAIAVRQVQNAVIWRVRKLADENYGPWVPDKPRVFCCRGVRDGTCPGQVHREKNREMVPCDGSEKGCDTGYPPRALFQYDVSTSWYPPAANYVPVWPGFLNAHEIMVGAMRSGGRRFR